MSTETTVALFAISSLSLLTSGATLVILLVGAKRVEREVEEVKEKTTSNLRKFKTALENLEV